MINFLLVALSVLAAGYAAATGAGQHLAGAGVALGGVATCAVFNVLDARTRELVAASENALAALQELLVQAGFPDTDLYARSCAGVRRAPSYRTSINALTAVAGAGFAVALVAALAS
ncbi:MAG: hypothetical protein ACJ71T_15610 [Actinomycetales bacterium]